jgi:polyisoprenoid-binding protein YceI
MKKITIVIILILLIAFAAFLYSIRPIKDPQNNVQTVSETLNPLTNATSIYRISQIDSKVEFSIKELLYGEPKIVVGTTSEIAGDIALTDSHLDIGIIKIDARTFITDNNQRNGAIVRLILRSNKEGNEYIVFRPISNDFTGTIVPGKSISFNVRGELIISGITKMAEFKVVALVTNDAITGTAETIINRSDYGIIIPNLPFIANVDNSFPVVAEIKAKKVN